MDEEKNLAARFETERTRLHGVAYRLLGSAGEADDAVQDAWLRLARADADAITNLGGWLTTVVARICLDMLRTRRSRREAPMGADTAEVVAEDDPEREALLADSVGHAMLVVLDRLTPAERIAFVLHDMFNLPFEDVALIVDRSPAAARQLASRARPRVHGTDTLPHADREARREVVAAFLAASREGDFAALLAVLDPGVVLRADAAAVAASHARAAAGAPALTPELRGAEAVAAIFKGRAQAAQPALVDGYPGIVFAPGGLPRVVFDVVVENGRIVEISLVADPESIAAMQLET